MRPDVLGGASRCGSMPVAQSLDRLAEVAEQVPAIGDLEGVRGTLTDAVGIGTGTIAGDNLDAWPLTQPGSDGGGLAVGQGIDHPVRLEVDQDRAVATPTRPGPVINPEDTRRRHDIGGSTGRCQAQQRVRARRRGDPDGQTDSGLAAEREAEVVLEISQALGSTTRAVRHVRQALGEGPTGAKAIEAVEPASSDMDHHRSPLPR